MLVLFFRVIILYFLTLLTIRLMGKREIGQLQPFDLIVNMMIAELVSQPLSDVNVPLMSGIIPVAVLLFLQLMVSFLCMHSRRIRRLICGEAVILADNGSLNTSYMSKMLITVDDVTEMLRTCNLKDINDLDKLIIETNGKPTVTEKKDSGIIITLIENGKVIRSNLARAGIREKDMISAMHTDGKADVGDVFWGFYFDGKYHFLGKEKK
ncbi:MAG: DUF421 domain-containing protein [Eubacteriaceae bacterium]|nr:DUF421 domain-containing protein [Eubacteriaceae bacterium]